MNKEERKPGAEIPRRIRQDKWTPEERAIYVARVVVESMPADVRLTNAGNKLQEAQNLVADFIDEIETPISPSPQTEIKKVISKWSLILLEDEGKDITYNRSVIQEILADFTASSIIDGSTPISPSPTLTKGELIEKAKEYLEKHLIGKAPNSERKIIAEKNASLLADFALSLSIPTKQVTDEEIRAKFDHYANYWNDSLVMDVDEFIEAVHDLLTKGKEEQK